MEIKYLFATLRKKWKIIGYFILTGFVLSCFVVLSQPKKYEVNFSLLISQTKTQDTKDFKYDTYYVLEAKNKIGDWLVAFLKSPENVNTILDSGGFDNSNFRVYDFRNFFRPYKASAQSIGIVFYLKDSGLTKSIVNNILLVANQELDRTYVPKKQDTVFEIQSTNPLVSTKDNNAFLLIFISILFSLGLSVVFILFKEYLTE